MQGLIGKKIGMTRICVETTGEMIPVTVIQTGENIVLQQKTEKLDGYSAVQLGFYSVSGKNQSKAEIGHAKKYGSEPVRYVREFALEAGEEVEAGQKIGAANFAASRFVDVAGTIKGRGFAGTVKKYNFRIGRATHGNTNRRDRGSLGAGTYPARVFPGQRMPGQYGNVNVSVKNLKVVKVDVERNLIFVKGAVPGPKNGLIKVRKA